MFLLTRKRSAMERTLVNTTRGVYTDKGGREGGRREEDSARKGFFRPEYTRFLSSLRYPQKGQTCKQRKERMGTKKPRTPSRRYQFSPGKKAVRRGGRLVTPLERDSVEGKRGKGFRNASGLCGGFNNVNFKKREPGRGKRETVGGGAGGGEKKWESSLLREF